jgi:hypothetical protein
MFCGQNADQEAGNLKQENCTKLDIIKSYINAENVFSAASIFSRHYNTLNN